MYKGLLRIAGESAEADDARVNGKAVTDWVVDTFGNNTNDVHHGLHHPFQSTATAQRRDIQRRVDGLCGMQPQSCESKRSHLECA